MFVFEGLIVQLNYNEIDLVKKIFILEKMKL